ELGVARPWSRPDAGAGMAGGAAEEGPQWFVKPKPPFLPVRHASEKSLRAESVESLRALERVFVPHGIEIVASPFLPEGHVIAMPPGMRAWASPDYLKTFDESVKRFAATKGACVILTDGGEP